jgi:type IV pilus assembly protein PilA
MLQKLQKRKDAGFTIIEVLIVLAIAGLIMLVVFLAVPALQRNSRNTQYREEASRILGAYNENSSNNAGAVLSASVSTTAGSDAANVLAAANTKNITTITIEAQGGSTAPSLTSAVIRTGAKCSAANSATTNAGSTRQVVILFMVETTSGTQAQCQEA